MKKKIFIACLVMIVLAASAAGIFLWRSTTIPLLLRDFAAPGFENNGEAGSKVRVPADSAAVKASIKAGVEFLLTVQKDGKWAGGHPGVGALCTKAILDSPLGITTANTPAIKQGLEYMVSIQRQDGSFSIPFSDSIAMNNYTTALAVLAMKADGSGKFDAQLSRARDYLVKVQKSENGGYKPEDADYGGIGYGGDGKPDLNNLSLALQAMREAGLPSDSEAFKKAQVFLSRCQDGEANDQSWAGGSGGFVYRPQAAEGGTSQPYGAMTFAGLNSLLFCSVSTEDPRVQDALRWVKRNFSVTEHPGRGQVSLYYYYYTMSKALAASGLKEIELEGGGRTDWRRALADELVARQRPDGSWVNPERKFLEGTPELATAYALCAMNLAWEGFKEETASGGAASALALSGNAEDSAFGGNIHIQVPAPGGNAGVPAVEIGR